MQSHILEEWRIRDVEQKVEHATHRLYELDSLRSDVGSLEHSLREIRSEIDGLRAELQTSQIQYSQDMNELRDRLDSIERRGNNEPTD